MKKELIRLISLLFLFSSTGQALLAQSFLDYKNLLNLNQENAVISLQEYGFEVLSQEEIDGCSVHKFNKGPSTFIYNICNDDEGVWINFVLLERDLKTMLDLLKMAKDDPLLSIENSTITSNSAMLFIEEELKELYFVLDHQIGLYTLSGSNYARFEEVKEYIESNINFDVQNNMISLFREIMGTENKSGETIQVALSKFDLNNAFDLLDIPSAFSFIEDFRLEKTQEQFKQIIDNEFLNDEAYTYKIQKLLSHLRIAGSSREMYIENLDEVLLKIAIENNQIKSFLMLNYICEDIQKEMSRNSSYPECDISKYATNALLKLKPVQLNRIVKNDTLYFKNDIVLTSSLFVCPEGVNRKMKVLRSLKDSTAFLIPETSDYRNDSLLYTNTLFFRSDLKSGLIVTVEKDRQNTHYDYPEDQALYALTSKLEQNGLYKLENGKFIFITKSMSQEKFKEYCTNETCYIPYPGILYDRMINLNQLKSFDELEK